jgi:hypothetical protein
MFSRMIFYTLFVVISFSCVQKNKEIVQAVFISTNGSKLTVIYNLKETNATVLLPGGKPYKLPQTLSASGTRYSDGTNTFWEHQGSGIFTRDDIVLFEGFLK